MRSLLWAKLLFICACFFLIPIYYSISAHLLAGYLAVAGLFLALYFSLPIWRVKWWVYVSASGLIAVLQLFVLSPLELFPWVFYYFLLLDSILTSSGKEKVIRTLGVMLPSAIVLMKLWMVELLIFHLFLSILFIGFGALLVAYASENEKIDKEWKSLLVEYRLLKRQVLENESVARVEERNRIARDIHDSVGHQLTALMMQLAVAEQAAKDKEIKGSLAHLKELARESLDGMRKAVKALQGEEDKGIASVIHLIRKLEAENQMRVQLTTKTGVLSVPLTNEQNIAIYRFVQEGITNAMRHGSSKEILIWMELVGGHSFQVAVTNRITAPAIMKEGFGLSNMRKRIEGLQGRLERVATDTHFTIKGIFPLRGDQHG